MTPIPAFRTIQHIHNSQTTKPDGEAISRAIAQTIRNEFDQNHKIQLDPLESHFLYKAGWAFLFLITFGQIVRVLPYSTARSEFRNYVRTYAHEIRHIHDAVDHAVRNKMPGIQTKLTNGLTVQIEERRGFIECERYEQYESRSVSIRIVKIAGAEVTKIAGQEVEISCMDMSDLLQFIDKVMVSKLS